MGWHGARSTPMTVAEGWRSAKSLYFSSLHVSDDELWVVMEGDIHGPDSRSRPDIEYHLRILHRREVEFILKSEVNHVVTANYP